MENQLPVLYTPSLIALYLIPTKLALFYTLVNRCFRTCCSWSMFHQQLILLLDVFEKNGYPENFIEKCFKLFLNKIDILKE